MNNEAAWIAAHRAHPYVVQPAPMPSPREGEILVRNRAVGVNPIEYKLQNSDIHSDVAVYPCIFGEDLAGDVVAVGPGVTSFRVGDRVAALAAGFLSRRNEERSFQRYVVARVDLACRLPDSLSYEQAAVFPLGLGTAAAGLFNPDFLGLELPTEPAREPPTGRTVLVWGGASCVGGNAIQMAVAAGYDVISTASPANFDRVRGLGARAVLDYHDTSVASGLVDCLGQGRQLVGVLNAIGAPASAQCAEFLRRVGRGGGMVATATPGWPDELPEGVTFKHVFSLSIVGNGVARAVWGDYLPRAMASGSFAAYPEPRVMGEGLASLQAAVDHVGTTGMSAEKAVVTL